MNIHRLLSTKERVRILKFVLYKTSPLYVNEVAKNLGLSKGLVSKFFSILSRENILKKTNNKFTVQDNLNTSAIKILLNLDNFDTNTFKKFKFVKGVGLYGSFVKGKNTEESDIDLWVLVGHDAQEENLARLTNELKKKHGNIKPLYLTKKKIKILKKEDVVFYHSLVFGSINIYGEELETI